MKKLFTTVFTLLLYPFVACSLGVAEETKIAESEHFQVLETKPSEAITVKFGENTATPELECVKQKAKIRELDDKQALLSRNISSRAGVNVEKLNLIKVQRKFSIINFVKQFFGDVKDELDFKIYELSEEELFKQARERVKFDLVGEEFTISIDGKEMQKLQIRKSLEDDFGWNKDLIDDFLDGKYYLDISEDNFFFEFENSGDAQAVVNFPVILRNESKGNNPPFIAKISFKINFYTRFGKLKFELSDPQIKS